MIWLAWRQQRTETLLTVFLFVVLALIFVPTGISMSDRYERDGLAACRSSDQVNCASLTEEFERRFTTVVGLTDWFGILPIVLAMLIAAPFVLELERGTYRLAWTQSITRERWLLTKLGMLLLGALVVSGAVSALFTWFRGPLDDIEGRIDPGAFLLEGPAMATYGVFAVALVIAIGAVLRHTVATIAISVVVFLALRVTIETWIRPHYQSAMSQPDTANLDLSTAWILRRETGAGGTTVLYHPDSRFWTFQGIEAGIFLVLTVVLIVFAYWWIRHRLS